VTGWRAVLSALCRLTSIQRKRAKIRKEDAILHKVEPEKAQEIIQQLQKEYPEK
jgi:hypothetical protein